MNPGDFDSRELRIDGRISQAEFEDRVRGFQGTVLTIRDARSLSSLKPLERVAALETLMADRPFAIVDLSPLAALGSLRHLRYGNTDLANDRMVATSDLSWARHLRSLENLERTATAA